MSDLVDRLRHDAHQLTKMVEHAKLAGPETGVRVKDPSLLLTDLSEAVDEIERLQRELDTANGLWTFWNEKARETAGKLAEARRQAFIEAAEIVEKQAPKAVRVFREEANITPPVLKAAFEILASAIRAKAEETSHE